MSREDLSNELLFKKIAEKLKWLKWLTEPVGNMVREYGEPSRREDEQLPEVWLLKNFGGFTFRFTQSLRNEHGGTLEIWSHQLDFDWTEELRGRLMCHIEYPEGVLDEEGRIVSSLVVHQSEDEYSGFQSNIRQVVESVPALLVKRLQRERARAEQRVYDEERQELMRQASQLQIG